MAESSQPSPTQKRPGTDSDGRGSKKNTRTSSGLNTRFVDTLGWVITGFWGFSMLLHAANIGYEPPMSIHILMMTVAGTAFGTNFIGRPRNGDENAS